MILHGEIDVAPTAQEVADVRRWPFPASAGQRNIFVLAAFFVLVVGLQLLGGAYRAEFGAYPDEPAHYVTALMLRDYITHFHFSSPVTFAADYYYHYPKVALGHWPPFFYIVQALWMLLFSASRTSVRLEIGFTTALLAFAVYQEARHWFAGRRFAEYAALLAGGLTICLPLVQTYAGEEMSESLLTLLCLCSVIFFIRYLDSERWQDNAWFGFFFALAVLTKGNGWLLAGVPVGAIALTRKFKLVTKPSFWAWAGIVGVLCVPWQMMTFRMAQRGWTGGTEWNLPYTVSALTDFISIFISICGPVLTGLMVVGILARVVVPAFRRPVSSGPAAMFTLIVSVWIFHSLVPAGVEDRKLIIAVPAMILFVFEGAIVVAERIPLRGAGARWRLPLVAIAGILSFSFQTFAIPKQFHTGYNQAAAFITSRPDLRSEVILVASQAEGEGLLVSEMAMRQPHPQAVIVRATKAMAQMDWNALNYHCFFSTPEQVSQYLMHRHIEAVVLDTFPPMVQFSHYKLLEEALERSGNYHLIAQFQSGARDYPGKIKVYKAESPTDNLATVSMRP